MIKAYKQIYPVSTGLISRALMQGRTYTSSETEMKLLVTLGCGTVKCIHVL